MSFSSIDLFADCCGLSLGLRICIPWNLYFNIWLQRVFALLGSLKIRDFFRLLFSASTGSLSPFLPFSESRSFAYAVGQKPHIPDVQIPVSDGKAADKAAIHRH
ncbi:hypothetical protein [Ruegeria denitrificans]|uniref:hypothetical protein n=1 Tax=Ruegeria denitrificans TaxID=1715692 RepID=UPI00103B2C6E|nr:hypothetical protein [Ruegeria denitrificans]